MSGSSTHLRKRSNGRYYVRIFIPKRLVNKFGRTELTRGLRVTSRIEAERLTKLINFGWYKLMDVAEREPAPSRADLLHLARIYFNEALEKAEEHRLARKVRSGEQEHLAALHTEIEERLAAWLARNDFSAPEIRDHVEAIAKLGNSSISNDPSGFRFLAHLSLRGLIEIHRLMGDRWQGNLDSKPKGPLFTALPKAIVETPVRQSVAEDNPSESISALVTKYTDRYKTIWKPRTTEKNVANLAVCSAIIGPTTPISSVDKSAIRSVRDTLAKLPPRWAAVYRDKTVTEAVQLAEKDNREPMHPTSINAYIGSLSGFFSWAVQEGYADKNPTQGIRALDPDDPGDKRDPFSIPQLQSIFNAPIYRGMRSERAWKHRGNVVIKDTRFWLPIIALFSGMRLGEIIALRRQHIIEVEGVPTFDVRGTKTRAAIRRIPIHPQLLQLGLLDYAERRQPDEFLFPDFTQKAYSKFFRRFQDACGIKDDKLVFHSFRHNFTDALRAARVGDAIAKSLIGHSDGTVTESYGNGQPIAVLSEAINVLSYPGLRLDLT